MCVHLRYSCRLFYPVTGSNGLIPQYNRCMSVSELESKLEILRIQRDTINTEIAGLHKELRIEADKLKGSDMKTVIFPIVRDFNCIIGDIANEQDFCLFGTEPLTLMPSTTTMWDILVQAGAFESKGQARKNWKGITVLPKGWTELGPIGKAKLHIFIWNPSE